MKDKVKQITKSSMSNKKKRCNSCGYVSAEEKHDLAHCDSCGSYCTACVAKMMVASGYFTKEEAQKHIENYGVSGFISESVISGRMLCLDCYDRERFNVEIDVVPENLIRVITKRNLIDIRMFEVKHGFRFNRVVSNKFLNNMEHDALLPVTGATINNGVEMRCSAADDKNGRSVLVDMSFESFLTLRQVNLQTGAVYYPPAPCNIPTGKPIRGAEVYRLLNKANLVSLARADEEEVQTNCELSTEEFIDTIPHHGVVEIRKASFKGINRLSCTAFIGEADESHHITFSLSVELYFALPIKVKKWPGWDNDTKLSNQKIA